VCNVSASSALTCFAVAIHILMSGLAREVDEIGKDGLVV
jgi:hypothetical protein